jgi:hypothetical protein
MITGASVVVVLFLLVARYARRRTGGRGEE